jgi:hypothetical protein
MMFDFIDFPTAWDMQRTGRLDHMDDKCSASQTNGAMLCDCGALNVEWETLKAEFPEAWRA